MNPSTRITNWRDEPAGPPATPAQIQVAMPDEVEALKRLGDVKE